MAGFQPSVKIPDAPPPGKPGLSFTEDGRMKALVPHLRRYDNDYSKWDALDASDDDAPPSKPRREEKPDAEQTASSLFELGYDHYVGRRGKAKDAAAAAKVWARAAARGSQRAQCSLAQLYYEGEGVTRSDAKALELYGAAAASGDARAKHSLAVYRFEGTACARDVPGAVALWTEAARAGVVPSMRMLAFVYLEGRGVPKNERLAFVYTKNAAKSGDPAARRNLAKMYNEGVGCAQNRELAMHLVGDLAEKYDKSCLDVTSQWFDTYVEASAQREGEARKASEDAERKRRGQGVPEWGGVKGHREDGAGAPESKHGGE